jgi:hypothetical protein
LHEIGRRQLDALPAATTDKDRKQYQQRKRSSGLREDERVDGMQRLSA